MAGGTEHQLVALVSRLDRHRFAPYVICLYGERAGRSLHFFRELQELDVPVSLLDMDWSVWDKAGAVVRLSREVRRIHPHIIQAINYHSNLLMRLARPFLPCNVKLIGCI